MEKIRVAIIGLGNIAHGYEDIPGVKKRIKYPTHLSVLKKDKRFKLVAASDVSAKQRRLFQKKITNSAKIYANYRAMLAGESIDLLVVAVPTQAHYAVCLGALRAGIKNILCEKPITRTLAEAEKLRAFAQRRRARILVNYQRSYSRGYEKFISEMRKKRWGRVVSVTVQYNNGVFNTATHFIHLLEKIFAPIQKVQSLKESTRGLDPNINFVGFARGCKIFFKGVDSTAHRLVKIDIKFTKRHVVLHGDSFISRSLLDVYENVYQVIKNKKEPQGSLDTALHVLRVATQAVASARSGKLLKV